MIRSVCPDAASKALAERISEWSQFRQVLPERLEAIMPNSR